MYRILVYFRNSTGYISFSLRRVTYIGWLGSGWPEWVAMDNNPQEFNQEVNRLQSIVSFTLIFANLIPGFWLDFCRKKWNGQSVRVSRTYNNITFLLRSVEIDSNGEKFLKKYTSSADVTVLL